MNKTMILTIKYGWTLVLFISVFNKAVGLNHEDELWEYCEETFHPQCKDGEIVVMTAAHYGHIRLGRCIDEDFGKLGCYADQLAVMDRKCSGMQTCQVDFKDVDMEGEFSCQLSKGLARYLEANYICRKVYEPPKGQCTSQNIVEATSRYNYLSSIDTANLGCGEVSKPWTIQAKEGQQINVSFIDFNWKVKDRKDAAQNCPSKYGNMVDVQSGDVVYICGGLTRERNLYTSKGSSLQVIINRDILDSTKFLIGFQAIGCPRFEAPPDTWIKIEDDHILVGCEAGGKTWRMRCIGTHWLGPLRDCAQYSSKSEQIRSSAAKSEENTFLNMPPAVSFSLLGGGLLVLISIAITAAVGLFCIRKPKHKSTGYVLPSNLPPQDLLVPMDNFPTYKSVQVKLPKKNNDTLRNNSVVKDAQFMRENTLPSLGSIPRIPPDSVPRRPPSLRESPHYYLLEGRDTTETEPLYDVVYQGLQDTN